MTIIDFAAKRQAAIEREREGLAEYLAEDELRKNINAVCYEHEARLEREHAQRQKYEAAMLSRNCPMLRGRKHEHPQVHRASSHERDKCEAAASCRRSDQPKKELINDQ